MYTIVGLVLVFLIFIAWPFGTIWGCARAWKAGRHWNPVTVFTLLGFVLATISGLRAIYAGMTGGFYYAPRILDWGMLISSAGLISSSIGVWKQSALRWHALVCSVSSLIFWFFMGVAE